MFKTSTGQKLDLNSFVLGEFIGEKLCIEHSSSKGLQGLKGIVLDETTNAFLIETSKGRKLVPKKGSVFLFPKHGVKVKGTLLIMRPEDRTKKLLKKMG
ncbi:MAG: ribonuclease P protein subunit [Candidatus Micrarchaeota archaeon]